MRVQYNDITASSKEGPLVTYFGHPKMSWGMGSDTDSSPKYELKIADSTTNVTVVTTSGSTSGANVTGFKVDGESIQHISSSKSDGVLGSQTAQIRAFPDDSSDNHLYFGDVYIPSPIHTSSHYQYFETPYLQELVGGDRNMEQTNLVVTADGKSWDEVTRDKSYIGNNILHTSTDTNGPSSTHISIMDEWRGTHGTKEWYQKSSDFAICWDRIVALRDGWYFSHATNLSVSAYAASKAASLVKNGTTILFGHSTNTGNYVNYHHAGTFEVKRGDYLQIQGYWHDTKDYGHWSIFRVAGPHDKPQGF